MARLERMPAARAKAELPDGSLGRWTGAEGSGPRCPSLHRRLGSLIGPDPSRSITCKALGGNVRVPGPGTGLGQPSGWACGGGGPRGHRKPGAGPSTRVTALAPNGSDVWPIRPIKIPIGHGNGSEAPPSGTPRGRRGKVPARAAGAMDSRGPGRGAWRWQARPGKSQMHPLRARRPAGPRGSRRPTRVLGLPPAHAGVPFTSRSGEAETGSRPGAKPSPATRPVAAAPQEDGSAAPLRQSPGLPRPGLSRSAGPPAISGRRGPRTGHPSPGKRP